METLLIPDRDVRALLPMRECIEVMAHALRSVTEEKSILPLRTVIRLPDTPNAFACMPAVLGAGPSAALGAKIITVFPGNDATPYDSHIGVVLLFDAEHGALLAIADASSVTAIRTAAVSGVATRVLAREDASELAILGAGVLAMPHLEAMRCVRPIRRVRVWSRSAARAHEFATRAGPVHDIEVSVCETAREAVTGAHVVCTITASRTPILEGKWLARGAHVNAVGASLPTARELDTAAVRNARLFVDRRESALNEAGDFLIPRSEGAIDDSHILGELGELLAGRMTGRLNGDQITLFKSLGLAVEDVAAVRHIYEKARATGSGTSIALGGLRTQT
ncbi:MAG: ornithine cyclodeaminase family protein [Gemmatimonadales bacterium]|jgi:ornithine cyclodeaminase